MKILIITYTREVNPGTFLQAYGVQYGLKQIFPKASIEYINHERLYSLTGKEKGSITAKKKDFTFIKSKILAIPRRIKYELLYRKLFRFSKESFNFFDYDENIFKKFAEKYDLICVGSDTILINIERNNHIGLMWLNKINTKKVFFAASAAPANFTIPDKYKYSLIKTFEESIHLGVRDAVTQNMLVTQLGIKENKIQLQPDPTYLIPNSLLEITSIYKRKLEKIRKKRKIALVNFTGECPYKKIISQAIKEKGYYIVSTHFNPDADWNIMTLSPFEWGALFYYIDITITDRFHDSVFTLRNNKLVFAIDWDNSRFNQNGFSKTFNLLNDYQLSDFHFIIKNQQDCNLFIEMFNKKHNVETKLIKLQIEKHNLQIGNIYKSFLDKIKSKYQL